ncbi:MAG: hypothetical protein H0U74_04340 [Bradymonadaceae bacterium]|nr:hypothetical protein [Lujinxingiaceae bacterium]
MLPARLHLLLYLLVIALAGTGCADGAQIEAEEDSLEVEAFVEEVSGKADASAEPRVELKLMLANDEISLARDTFGLKRKIAALSAVYFYDTPELELYEGGLILRSRSQQGDVDDSTVKHRPMTNDDVDAELLGREGFKCEIDRSPDKEVSSCSFTVVQDKGEIADVARGARAIDKLFSARQELFAQEFLGDQTIAWDTLEVLGPIEVLKWKVSTKKLEQRLTLELWTLADGTQMLEVSTKVTPDQADKVQTKMLAYIASKGLRIDAEQITKTRVAMTSMSTQP